MENENIDQDDQEKTDVSDGSTRAARLLAEKSRKRHRKASLGKLIVYIFALIGIIVLMIWLKQK